MIRSVNLPIFERSDDGEVTEDGRVCRLASHYCVSVGEGHTKQIPRYVQISAFTRPAFLQPIRSSSVRLDPIDWIDGFHNAQRLHSSIDYQSPAMLESYHLYPA